MLAPMKLRFLTLVTTTALSFACSSENERPPALNTNLDAGKGDVYFADLAVPVPDTAADASDAADVDDGDAFDSREDSLADGDTHARDEAGDVGDGDAGELSDGDSDAS